MKFCTVAAVLLVSVFASSMALPARLGYYQQPSFYYQSHAAPQRLMYLQYVQQPSSSKTSARLTNAAAAFVAGDTVATGTFLKDDASAEQTIAEESILANTGANGAQSIAEAYPSGSGETDDAQDDGDVDAAEINESVVPEEAPELPEDNQVFEDEPLADEAEASDSNDEAPAEADPEPSVSLAAAPSVPEVPEPAAADLPQNDDDEDDDEDQAVVPNNARRQVASKAAPTPLPAGTFFPIDFGSTSGGAIAIANALSTGVSGSAKSQAIAYGRPQTKSNPSRRRRH